MHRLYLYFIAAISMAGAHAADIADTVFTHGKIVTVDERFSIAEAVAIANGKFIGVGTSEEMNALVGPTTEVFDLQGKTVVPGLIMATRTWTARV
jgi:predicted amidohydrolase YtcJ